MEEPVIFQTIAQELFRMQHMMIILLQDPGDMAQQQNDRFDSDGIQLCWAGERHHSQALEGHHKFDTGALSGPATLALSKHSTGHGHETSDQGTC